MRCRRAGESPGNRPKTAFAVAETGIFLGTGPLDGTSLRKTVKGRHFGELSTEISPRMPTGYPQEFFMLQCFFLVGPGCSGDSCLTAEGNRSGNAKAPRSRSDQVRDMSPDMIAKDHGGRHRNRSFGKGKDGELQGCSGWTERLRAARSGKASGCGFGHDAKTASEHLAPFPVSQRLIPKDRAGPACFRNEPRLRQ